jgi:DNA-directed RNA polymerase beta subunit
MLDINNFNLYTTRHNSFSLKEKGYTFFVIGHNDTFDNIYPFLNVSRKYVRRIFFPFNAKMISRRLYKNKKDIEKYRNERFIVRMNDPISFDGENYFYMLNKHFELFDSYYDGQYKNTKPRVVFNNIITGIENEMQQTKNKKVLIYSVNRNLEIGTLFNSKFYLLYNYISQQQKENNKIFFDQIFFHLFDLDGNVSYLKVANEDKCELKRIKSIFLKINQKENGNFNVINDEEISEKLINNINDDVIYNDEDNNDEENMSKDAKKIKKEKLKEIFSEKLKEDDNTKEIIKNIIENDKLDKKEKEKRLNTITLSILSDKENKKDINKKNDFEKKAETKKLIDNSIKYNLTDKKYEFNSMTEQDKIVKSDNNIVGDNTGKKYRQFRKIQYDVKLKNDLKTVVNTLSTKKYPLQLIDMTFEDVIETKQDILESDLQRINVTLKDDKNKLQHISFIIPKMNGDNFLKLNGRKKILLNQMMPLPVYFFKPHHCRVSTIYNTITLYDKVNIKTPYMMVYVSGKKMPLIYFLLINNSLEQVNMMYNVKMTRYDTFGQYKGSHKPKKYSLYLNFKNFVYVFDMDDLSSFHLYYGFLYNKKQLTEFVDNNNLLDIIDIKLWSKFINDFFDNYGISFKIKQTYQNLLDPLSIDILKNKNYPYQIDELIKYIVKKLIDDDIDRKNELSNYRVRNYEVIAHLILKDIMIAYAKYEKARTANLEESKLEINPWQTFSTIQTAKLISDVENINALEELTYIDRITFGGDIVGIGGDSQDSQIRSVDDSYYGVIDSADTPEGAQGVGITQHLSLGSNISDIYGNLEIKDKMKEINDNSTLSISSSVVPFIEKSEPTRIMFATNHQKQGVPLKNKQSPIVRTGYEQLVAHLASDDFIIRSKINGKINEIKENEYIEVIFNDKKIKHDIKPKLLRTGTGLVSISFFTPVVKKGQSVKKDSVLANGANIKNNTFSNGNNAICAYMTWKGYGFEDGIIVSEKLANQMSTYTVIEKEYALNENDSIEYIITETDKEIKKGETIIKIKPEKVSDLSLYTNEDDEEDILNPKIDFNFGIIEFSVNTNCKIIGFEIYGDLNNFANIKKDLSKYWDGSKKTYKREKIEGLIIKIKLYNEIPIRLGDKVANRHGNKGVVCYVEKNENMPITPWGEQIDLLLNPISVIGRTNTGQIYETYLGLISHILKRKVLHAKTNKKNNLDLILSIYRTLDNTKGLKIYNSFKNYFDKMTEKEYKDYLNDIEENGIIMYAPSFKGPTNKQIEKALKILKLDTKMKVYLPEAKTETKNPVVIGMMYEQRLEHLSGKKAFSRSTGIYRTGVGQPTQGKRSGGGLKVGELDSWALMSYDVPHVLAELFYPMSDDHKAKNQMISNIIKDGSTNLTISKDKTNTDEIIKAYLLSMGIEEKSELI